MFRDLILKFGVIALLLCAISIGLLSSFAADDIRQLSYLADDEPPSQTPHSLRVRKKRMTALTVISTVRITGYVACGIGITSLMYCLVREKRMENQLNSHFTLSKSKKPNKAEMATPRKPSD